MVQTEKRTADFEELRDIEVVKAALKRAGTPRGFGVNLEKRRRIFQRLLDEQPILTEKHPGKWVAMGLDGVLAVGDSFDQVSAEIEGADDAQVEYIYPSPQSAMTPLRLLSPRSSAT